MSHGLNIGACEWFCLTLLFSSPLPPPHAEGERIVGMLCDKVLINLIKWSAEVELATQTGAWTLSMRVAWARMRDTRMKTSFIRCGLHTRGKEKCVVQRTGHFRT